MPGGVKPKYLKDKINPPANGRGHSRRRHRHAYAPPHGGNADHARAEPSDEITGPDRTQLAIYAIHNKLVE
ncbi:MAG: hypothetical protein AB1767_05455 [Bacillota bacterium]